VTGVAAKLMIPLLAVGLASCGDTTKISIPETDEAPGAWLRTDGSVIAYWAEQAPGDADYVGAIVPRDAKPLRAGSDGRASRTELLEALSLCNPGDALSVGTLRGSPGHHLAALVYVQSQDAQADLSVAQCVKDRVAHGFSVGVGKIDADPRNFDQTPFVKLHAKKN